MKARSAGLCFAALTLAALAGSGMAAAAQNTIFYLGGFPSETGLTFNGGATINSGSLQLTAEQPNQASTVFWNERVTISDDFRTRFLFQVGPGSSPTADGLTFTLQNSASGSTALGQGGSGLGYTGIDNSIAFTFDVLNNTTGVRLNGAATGPTASLNAAGINLSAGNPIAVALQYAGTTLSAQVGDTVTGRTVTTRYTGLDIAQIIGSDQAYAGFTAGTGSGFARQSIQNWSLTGFSAGSPSVAAYSLPAGRGTALNNNLQVAGGQANGQNFMPALFIPGTGGQVGSTLLPLGANQREGFGSVIANNGNVGGYQRDSAGQSTGTLWRRDGSMATVPSVPGFNNSAIAAMNDTVILANYVSSTGSHIYRSTDMGRTWTRVEPPGGAPFAAIRDINTSGFGVGVSSTDGQTNQAFLMQPNGATNSFQAPNGFTGIGVHDITDFDANTPGDTIVAVGGAARAGDGTLQPALFRKDMTTEVLSLPPTARQGFVVAVDPTNLNRVYVNAQGINGKSFVAYSNDGGRTWRDINSLIPPTNRVLPVTQIVAGNPTGTALIGRNAGQDVVLVTHAETRSHPTDAGQTALSVTGTGGSDVITVTPVSANDTDGRNTFQVVLNNVPQGTFTADTVIVRGLAGDDTMTVSSTQKPVILFGGDGNDRLEVGNGPNILAGGTGNDMLVGGLQQDVLIGGTGSDNLIGGDGDDILLGGSSAFDSGTPADAAALEALLRSWISVTNFQERNAAVNLFLRPGAVHGGTPNTMTGGSGRDLFFFGRGDQMLDFDRADDAVTTLL